MLIRLFAIPAAFLAVVLIATTCSAQFQVYPITGGYGPGSSCPSLPGPDQRYGSYRPDIHPQRFVSYRPDVVQLDQWADGLAQAARHLHEDAHQLGQDYEHSRSIEAYVSRLDRLNEHMHGILHRAAGRRHLSTSEIRHVAGDVLDVRRLAIRLDRELAHQRIDGARTQDFHALDHMRQIIRNMEYELDYRSIAHHGPRHPTYTAHRHGY